VAGREHLPTDEQVVYVANHGSFLDPLLMAAVMGPARMARTQSASVKLLPIPPAPEVRFGVLMLTMPGTSKYSSPPRFAV
jgi:hypothetical protein